MSTSSTSPATGQWGIRPSQPFWQANHCTALAASGPLVVSGPPALKRWVPCAHQHQIKGHGQEGPYTVPSPTFGAASTQDAAAVWMQWWKAQAANSALWLHGYSSDDQENTAANAHLSGCEATLAPLLSWDTQEQGIKWQRSGCQCHAPCAAVTRRKPFPIFFPPSLPFLSLFTKSKWMFKNPWSDRSIQAALHLERIDIQAVDSVISLIGSSSHGERPGPTLLVIYKENCFHRQHMKDTSSRLAPRLACKNVFEFLISRRLQRGPSAD